jgi:hypothetical protein
MFISSGDKEGSKDSGSATLCVSNERPRKVFCGVEGGSLEQPAIKTMDPA